MTKYYKVLGSDRMPFHGGRGQWPEPGEWLSVSGPLVPCQHGLHVCTRDQLVRWLGPQIWRVEVDGDVLDAGDKCVVHRARLISRFNAWNARTQRLFACDCAEAVVHLCGADPRPAEAIRVARLYAHGMASGKELDAARDAAWDAARDAAGVAAGAAAGAAAGDAARTAAAAWAATRDVDWGAAEDGVWDAQTDILFDYLEGRRW